MQLLSGGCARATARNNCAQLTIQEHQLWKPRTLCRRQWRAGCVCDRGWSSSTLLSSSAAVAVQVGRARQFASCWRSEGAATAYLLNASSSSSVQPPLTLATGYLRFLLALMLVKPASRAGPALAIDQPGGHNDMSSTRVHLDTEAKQHGQQKQDVKPAIAGARCESFVCKLEPRGVDELRGPCIKPCTQAFETKSWSYYLDGELGPLQLTRLHPG